jgi:hypothetical protein
LNLESVYGPGERNARKIRKMTKNSFWVQRLFILIWSTDIVGKTPTGRTINKNDYEN